MHLVLFPLCLRRFVALAGLGLPLVACTACTTRVVEVERPVGAPTDTQQPAMPTEAPDAANETGPATPSNNQDPGHSKDDEPKPPALGAIAFIAPALSFDTSTGVYTASFRIKNTTLESILEFRSVEVKGSYAFPKINRATCPSDTPGYPWDVPPNGMSSLLGIVFASSPDAQRTVIDLTCGSKEALQSVPYGFNANPPFTITIDFVLASGETQKTTQVFSL